eukprot:11259935-Karenia_brevis.AAC.1
MVDDLQKAFAGHTLAMEELGRRNEETAQATRLGLQQIYTDAQAEFQNAHNLLQQAAKQMEEIKARLTVVETNKQAHSGYLPHKTTVPKVLGEKVETWRNWKEDVTDFLDAANPGMKNMLKAVEKEQELVTQEWLQTEMRSGRHEM